MSLATRLAYSRARPLRLALRRHMGKGRLAVAAQVEEEVEEDRAEDEVAARLVKAGVVEVAEEVARQAEEAVSEAEEQGEVVARAAREIGHGRIRTRRAGRTTTGSADTTRRWRKQEGRVDSRRVMLPHLDSTLDFTVCSSESLPLNDDSRPEKILRCAEVSRDNQVPRNGAGPERARNSSCCSCGYPSERTRYPFGLEK